MERLNKEININVSDCIDVKYGSVNKNKPQVIYIIGKTWLSYHLESVNSSIVKKIMSSFKREITKSLSHVNIFSDNILFDYDINLDFKNSNKFMTFEIFLKQKKMEIKSMKNFENSIYNIIYNPIQDLIFNFNKNNFTLNTKKSK